MKTRIARIKSKIQDLFSGMIDMSDISQDNTDEFDRKLSTRALAAYAIQMLTNVDYKTAAASVTDGYNDEGIDALYCDDDSKIIHVIQSKWHSNGQATITLADTLKSLSGVDRILNFQIEACNEKIQRKRVEIEDAIIQADFQLQLTFIYTSRNKLADEILNAIDKKIEQINFDGFELLKVKSLSLDDIFGHLLNTTGTQNINLNDVTLKGWGQYGGTTPKVYYGMISAAEIAHWWKEHKNLLFDKNIRHFKGDTHVNQGIIDCLLKEPTKFPYFNNGIKLVVNKIVRKLAYSTDKNLGYFSLEGVSIVNGAQTVGCIGTAYEKSPHLLKDINIMAQIIELNDKPEDFRKEITRLSNTQNRIDHITFISLDSWHENMRRDLLLDGYKYSYKDGRPPILNKNCCTVDDVTVALGCRNDDVSISATIKGNYGSIFEDQSKHPYKTIFNDNVNTYYLWNSVSIYKIFEEKNEEYQRENDGISKLISIHGNRFLLHLIFSSLKEYVQIHNQQYSVFDETFKIWMKYAIEKYVQLTIKAKHDKYPEAYPANTFRITNRCRELKNSINIIPYRENSSALVVTSTASNESSSVTSCNKESAETSPLYQGEFCFS